MEDCFAIHRITRYAREGLTAPRFARRSFKLGTIFVCFADSSGSDPPFDKALLILRLLRRLIISRIHFSFERYLMVEMVDGDPASQDRPFLFSLLDQAQNSLFLGASGPLPT